MLVTRGLLRRVLGQAELPRQIRIEVTRTGRIFRYK